jgi:quinol monooxygenase YgiN
MRQVIVQYRVKPDRAAENERLVRAVYDELHRTKPSGLRYATFQLEDDVSFVHVAEVDDETENPLAQLEAFRAFQAEIQDRCEEPPNARRAREIGSFRMFDR